MRAKKLQTLIKRCLLGSMFSLGAVSTAQAATVDLLVTYDDASRNYYKGEVDAAMRSWVSQANEIYRNSQVDIQLRLVGTMHHNIRGNGFNDILPVLRVDRTVAEKRKQVGADFVTHLTPGNCGLGYSAVDKNWAFNTIGPGCGAQVMVHELGHNMGLNHSRRQGNSRGARFRYGLGHGIDGVFATTMAYPHVFGTRWVPTMSNPRKSCNGLPCGVNAGNWNEADATKALNNISNEIAGFFKAPNAPKGPSAPKGPNAPKANAYTFRAAHSNRCLDVQSWSKQNDAPITQWDCHGGANQRFRLLDAGGGYWYVQSVHSGKCLDVRRASPEQGAAILQWDCHGGDNQKLKRENLGGNLYQFTFKHSGNCMDVNNSKNGSPVYQYGCHSGKNQRFYLES